MRGGRGGPPGGMGGPGRGGPMGKPGGNMEGDRWGKRALPPPPPGSGGGAIAGLPALHKTDKKFKVRLDHAVKAVFLNLWKNSELGVLSDYFYRLLVEVCQGFCSLCTIRVCHLVRDHAGAVLQH